MTAPPAPPAVKRGDVSRSTADVLSRYPLFAVLNPHWLESWIRSGMSLGVALGDTLFQAGTPGAHVYLVQEGKVRVLRATKDGGEVSVGVAGPGHLLGEYAVVPPGLNTATCRAAGPARVLRLPLPPLREALAARPDLAPHLKRWLRLHALLGFRRGGLLLGFLSASSLLPLLDRFEAVSVRAAHAVQADGLGADRWFLIQSGEVRVHPAADDPTGVPVLLGPGDCFGERALLDGKGLPLAVAHADIECLYLRREAFYQPLTAGKDPSVQTYRGQAAPARRPYPWVGQQEATDCGVASLAMIARFHGRDVSPEALRRSVRLGPRGASLMALQEAAAALGFGCQAVRVGADQLADVTLPAVAHLAEGHYVVVYERGRDGIVVGDPAAGVVTLGADSFRRAWSGNLLLLTPPDEARGS
jgi:CRP-like cAMP-binding protein